MSDQDPFPAEKPDNPRDMTPDELEEALRWLEDLAGKQGKSLDGLITMDETSLADSPFKGLFDSDEQEMPDWLREVPSLISDEGEIQEGESALDWLARMASRESIEELPTLEWRRLTEGEEDDDVVEAMPETAAAIAGLPSPETVEPEAPVYEVPQAAAEDDSPAVVALMKSMAEAERAGVEALSGSEPEVGADPAGDTEAGLTVDPPPPAEPLTPVVSDTAAKDESEALLAELQAGLSEAGVAPDDLDDAMAWLEELAASQDSPIEDLPSVADRALASKLIAEAASGLATTEGIDVSQLGIALSGIYVGETKLAPEGPLVGQGPADETPDSAIYAEMALALEPEEDHVALPAGHDDAPRAIAPAVTAVVDEPVAADADGLSPTEELVDRTVLEPATLDPATEEIRPVEPAVGAEPATDATLADLMVDPPAPPRTLAEYLVEIDRLALPADTSLNEIKALLDADPTPVKVTPFSLESTLAWLEGGANGAPADLLDDGLVAAMPDDPDEAQAWLQQLAAEPDVTSPVAPPAMTEAVNALDLTEADLLDMPEDPDAAIAWIESLAARREQSNP